MKAVFETHNRLCEKHHVNIRTNLYGPNPAKKEKRAGEFIFVNIRNNLYGPYNDKRA
ncbi:MAG: hypothetical protein K6U74_16300 [Firmicutes bacterium]|nr:hypothetical protein [Bacillota bacterium]